MNLKEVTEKHGKNASEYFTFAEFINSATARKKKIQNTINQESVNNLIRLGELLDEVREMINVPINVNSGYRCAELNKAVGGTANSSHKFGMAADIVSSVLPKALFQMLRESNIQFDKIILYPTFIHFGICGSKSKPRRQVLMAVGSGQYKLITENTVI